MLEVAKSGEKVPKHGHVALKGEKGSIPGGLPVFEQAAVPYGKLFRWGWYVVSGALGWFITNTLLTVFLQVLTQFNVQVLAAVVSGLNSSIDSAKNPPAETVAGVGSTSDGFLSYFVPKEPENALVLFAILAGFVILLRFVDRLLTNWTDSTMLGRLQQRLHDKLLTLGPSYHRRHDVSETLLTVTQFAGGAQQLLRDLVASPIVRVVSLTTALIFLINNMEAVGNKMGGVEDTPLLWIRGSLIALLIILPVGGWWLSKRMRVAFQRVLDSQTAVANEFANSASAPLEVQLMGVVEQRKKAFAASVRVLIRNRVSATLRREIASQFQATVPLLLQMAFLFYGVFFALESGNPKAPGAILAIYYFVPEAVTPIQEIIQLFAGLNSAWPQVEKVVEILEAEPEVREADPAADLSPGTGAVALENVTFSYAPDSPDGHRILDNLTHTFLAGKTTAIVAPSGGGKSSLLNLVARLWDPQNGQIDINDQDIAKVTLSSLRHQVAKMSQFPMWINDTVRANFQLAREDVSDAEIEAVCRRTGIWKVLEGKMKSLMQSPHSESAQDAGEKEKKIKAICQRTGKNPDQLTPLDYILPRIVTEDLSGGESRLLAISRVLLTNPEVMLIDEPTTGVDQSRRLEISDALRDNCKGRTVLLVDWDMNFIHHTADQVCCLEGGKFTAVGAPDELAERPTLYKQLRDDGQWLRPKSIQKLVAVPCQEAMSEVVGQSQGTWLTCPKCGDLVVQPADLEHGRYLVGCSRCNESFWVARHRSPEVEGQSVESRYSQKCPACGFLNDDMTMSDGRLRPVTCRHCGISYYSF